MSRWSGAPNVRTASDRSRNGVVLSLMRFSSEKGM